jgi:hypothetical protein
VPGGALDGPVAHETVSRMTEITTAQGRMFCFVMTSIIFSYAMLYHNGLQDARELRS